MKKKFSRILGVGLTLVLLTSLMAFAAPVSAADLKWTPVKTPGGVAAAGWTINAGSDVNLVAVSPDGSTLFAAENVAGPTIYRSTNGGSFWTAATVAPPAAVVAMVVSPNYDVDSTVIAATATAVYKSTNGGATFTQMSTALTGTEQYTSLAISPTYGTDGLLVAGTADTADNAYGTAYVFGRPATFGWVQFDTGYNADVTSVAFSPNFPTDYSVLAVGSREISSETATATVTTAFVDGGDAAAEVFNITYTNQAGTAGQAGTVTIPVNAAVGATAAVALAVGDTGIQDITAIADAGNDATAGAFRINTDLSNVVLATWAVTGAGAGTFTDGVVTPLGTDLQAAVNWGAFDAVIPLASINAAAEVGDAGAQDIVSSAIAPVSDYDGMNVLRRRVYVATNSVLAAADDVYRVTGTTATALGLTALGPPAPAPASLVYDGDYTTGTAFFGDAGSSKVYTCANPTAGAGWIWTASALAPTGTGNTQLVLAPDFVTSNRIYAGTSGAVADESAVSISDDSGANFYQIGLIDTVISAIKDVMPSPAYATDSTIFMVTAFTGAANVESLWKSTNGGVNWMRVWNLATDSDDAIVRLSPDYATDQTVYFAERGDGTILGEDLQIRASNTAGASWGTYTYTSPLPIADLVVESSTTIYVAGGGTTGGLAKSVNSGWTWLPAMGTNSGGAPVIDMAQAPNGDILIGLNNNNVYRSTDGGANFAVVGATGVAVGGGEIVVAFDANYDTNSTIYAGDSQAAPVAGIYRFVIDTDTAWQLLDNSTCAKCQAIAVASDGTLYATDATAATAAGAGGVVRSLSPTAKIVAGGVSPEFEHVSAAADDFLPALVTLSCLAVAEGSNILFAIDSGSAAQFYSWTDTLSTVSPAMVAPAEGEVSTTSTGAVLVWDAVTGAKSYKYAYGTRSDFIGAATGTTNDPVVNAAITGLAEGKTYYWRVRVETPVIGPWSAGRTFDTQIVSEITAPSPTAPAPPAHLNVPLEPVFNWLALKWATGYEFQLATDAAMTETIVDLSGTNALGAVTSYSLTTPLSYSTTYYWRVRGITSTSQSDWSETVGFTTMAEPVEPEPVEPAAPAPPVEVTTVEAIPTYLLWVIIAVAIVLVIALIVLIWRTRRAA